MSRLNGGNRAMMIGTSEVLQHNEILYNADVDDEVINVEVLL